MAFEFLKPVSDEVQAHAMLQPQHAIGNVIKIHTAHTGLPQLKDVQMVLVGVLENRRDENALLQIKNVDQARKQFYELFPGNWLLNIVDMGDIHPGDKVEDTYYVLQQLTAEFLTKKIIPIYLGGSQDLMYPIYRAFDDIKYMINVVNVDCRFDIGDIELPISSRSYVGKMVADQPYNLFNYSNLGFQTYFNSQDEIELLERMYFDATRLGVLDEDIKLAEPVMRDADVVGG
ncbi:formiminoglutamase [Nonlabens ulvanivorans]|nr:formiminoglutamase [Nonlabens ulvanivorans]